MRRQAGRRSGATIDKEPTDRMIPAMPVRINHYATYAEYKLETEGGVPIFRASYPEVIDEQLKSPEETLQFLNTRALGMCRDPYALRRSFEQLKSPEGALEFLNTAGGCFRRLRRDIKDFNSLLLSWPEMEGWREIVKRLVCLDPSEWFPLLARYPLLGSCESILGSSSASILESNLKKAFNKSLCETFGAGLDHLAELIWRVSDDTCQLLQGMPPTLSIQRDIYLPRTEINEIFSMFPGSDLPGSRAQQHALFALRRRQADKARGTPGLKPTLITEITTGSVLDAILATVYVDKLRGKDIQICALKECEATFEKSSPDSTKMYCGHPHAHLASVRNTRDKARKKKAANLRGKEIRICALKGCKVTFETSPDSNKRYCTEHRRLGSALKKRNEARKKKAAKLR